MINKILDLQSAVPAAVLIRVIVGYVFFVEGVQKFLFPDTLGVGRFIKIGIPMPHLMVNISGGGGNYLRGLVGDWFIHKALYDTTHYQYYGCHYINQGHDVCPKRVLACGP